jgi:hypothetical protein
VFVGAGVFVGPVGVTVGIVGSKVGKELGLLVGFKVMDLVR